MLALSRTEHDPLTPADTSNLGRDHPPPSLAYRSFPSGSSPPFPPPPLPSTAAAPHQSYSSRFSSRRFPPKSTASVVTQSATTNQDGTKLPKKPSKPFLGWFARKLRKSIGASSAGLDGRPGGDAGDEGVRGRPAQKRRSSWGGGAGAAGQLPAGEHQHQTVDPLTVGSDEPSEYGRLVANNGLSYLHQGPQQARARRRLSEVSEGGRTSTFDDDETNDDDDDNDYRSVATSLDPFPPSHHRPSMRHQSISSSRWTPSSFTANSSSSTLDDYSTTASASIRYPGYRGRAGSDTHAGFNHSGEATPDVLDTPVEVEDDMMHDIDDDEETDDGASLRPIPPSIPPSPSPSGYARTIAPSISSSRSYSYAASLAPSSRSRGWRSIVTNATPTTAVTSIESGSTSTGRAESIVHGTMAHIAQVPREGSPGPGPSSQLGAPISIVNGRQGPYGHARRESWTSNSFNPVLEQTTSSPVPPPPSSPLSQPTGGRLRAPSSPTALSSTNPSRWGSTSATTSPPALLRPATTTGTSRESTTWSSASHAHGRPTSLLSHALATSALAGSSHRSSVDSTHGPLDPAGSVAIPLQTLSSPSPAYLSSSYGPSPLSTSLPLSSSSPLEEERPHPHHATHSTPHPRNNPNPSAAPNDNASLLTLASSSFFIPPSSNTHPNGSGITTGSVPSGYVGRQGGPSLSIRRGVERAESVTFSFAGGGTHGRRRSFETFGAGGGAERMVGGGRLDDQGASVRAVRRKGSWESGESRWSAAAVPSWTSTPQAQQQQPPQLGQQSIVGPSNASIRTNGRYYVQGAGERDSIAGLWSGPAWTTTLNRQGSILTVDPTREDTKARSVSFSFRSAEFESSRRSRRRGRRRSSSVDGSDSDSSRSEAHRGFDDDGSDDEGALEEQDVTLLQEGSLALDPSYERRDSGTDASLALASDDHHVHEHYELGGGMVGSESEGGGDGSRESGTEEEARTPAAEIVLQEQRGLGKGRPSLREPRAEGGEELYS